MDLVVRTPHGDADVSIVRHGPTCTLGDLIAAVSGQAVPRVARVDDRTVDCATPLDAAPLLIGSIVTTDPAVPVPRQPDDVELVQLAGPGAGRSRLLTVGRYRIGPGRRVRADELSFATVEEPGFEITVATDGVVTVGEAGDRQLSSVRLAGSPAGSNVAWDDGILTVDNRAFVIDRGPPSGPRRLPPPDPDGTVAFSRPPLRPDAAPRLLAIDAVRDATAARPTLWQRRPDRPGAFVIPIGVREGRAGDADDLGEVEVVEIDLFTERAVAVAGGEAARTALARSILVEITTAHGPADLDVVIATAPDRLAEWDWAKWLPHVRSIDGPMVFATRDDIAAWAHPSADRRTSASAHLTLLVLDDPDLWSRRESPLRSLLASRPASLRVIALCDDAGLAPASCTTLITESPDRRWHVLSLTDDVDTDGVIGALMEPGVAAEVARALAPLVDSELPELAVVPEPATPRCSLLRCLGDPTPDDLRRNWADPDIDLTAVPFGVDDSVRFDLTSHDIVVAASDPREADRVAVTIAVAACMRLGPSAMLLLDLGAAASSALNEFPHSVGGVVKGAGNAMDAGRLIARIGHVLALEDAAQFVVVIIGAATDPHLRDALLAASPDVPGLCLIVATADAAIGNPPGRTPDHMIKITVERRGDRRRAVVDTPSGPTDVHLDDDPGDEAELVLRPLVLGRALTPLEHRIEQRSQSIPLSFMAACRDLARRAHAATDEIDHPWIVPTPLPSSIDTDALFAEWPGDAVPIGLIDVATTGQQPIWWQPDDGLLVAFGSLRSGVDDLFATVLLGMIDRIAPADAELVVVDRSATRRQVIRTIDRRHLVVAPDEPGDLTALLEVLETPVGLDGRRPVVVIDDLGHLRAQAAVKGALDRLDRALTAARSVVAVARTADDAGPLLTAPGRHLIGSLADPDDQRRLGGPPDGPRGRCRLLETGVPVQLAALPRSLASAIPERLTHPRDGAQ